MRLFVAVYPPPAAADSLSAALPPLPTPWRPVPAEQWHLTLTFLGEVDQARLEPLAERLARAAARSGPLTLAFAGAGSFPTASRARVLWVGVTGDRDGLGRMADRTTAAARRTGLAVPDRRYRPHLTLARARPQGGADAAGVVAALAGYAGPAWPVGEVVLVRSVLGAAACHERVDGWPLAT